MGKPKTIPGIAYLLVLGPVQNLGNPKATSLRFWESSFSGEGNIETNMITGGLEEVERGA